MEVLAYLRGNWDWNDKLAVVLFRQPDHGSMLLLLPVFVLSPSVPATLRFQPPREAPGDLGMYDSFLGESRGLALDQ